MPEMTTSDKKYIINNSHCLSIEKVLVIEDSLMLLHSIKESIHTEFNIECDIASNEQEAMHLLQTNSYDLVIADIYLPDSSGNFIGYLVRKKHRIIIITASQNEERRVDLERNHSKKLETQNSNEGFNHVRREKSFENELLWRTVEKVGNQESTGYAKPR